MTVQMPARARAVLDRHGIRMAKYLIGSLVAMLVSTVTFMGTFGPGLLGSRGASLTASATGAVVNYFLNRQWAWGRRGRADFRTEVVPYWRTVITTALAAALVTWGVNSLVRDVTPNRGIRTLANTIAFLATYGIAFLFKYRVFDRLFGHEHRQVQLPPDTDTDPTAAGRRDRASETTAA